MVIEQALIKIKAGQEQAFEKKFYEVSDVFRNAQGCQKFRLLRGIEHSGHYALVIQWDNIESHTDIFIKTDEFKNWFKAIGPFLADKIHMEHFERTI